MKATLAVFLATILLTGCTITQTVDPVLAPETNQVCVVENPAVRQGFLAEVKSALQDKNAKVRVLNADASNSDCQLVLRYVARWSWDLTIYMSYAEIDVFQNGRHAGQALYDATNGSGRLDKFVDAEPKIRELVFELFPEAFIADEPQSVVNIDDHAQRAGLKSELDANNRSENTDLYSELLKLGELRDKGLLTSEEFETEKQKLLETN